MKPAGYLIAVAFALAPSVAASGAMSLSLLKFVGRRRWLMMLCCLHDGFNGTGLSLSQVFLESISDGQLAIGLEATEGFLGLQQAGGGPSAPSRRVSSV